MTEAWLAFGAALVPWAALTFVRLKRFLHILQLEEYLTRPYLHWLVANPARYLAPAFVAIAGGGLVAGLLLLALLLGKSAFLGLLVWLAAGIALAPRLRSRRKARKPLVLTARARRLLVTGLLIAAAKVAVATGIGLLFSERAGIALGVLAATLVCALAGHALAAANLALWPLEERARQRFQRQAMAKLAQKRPRIIAITGSAGKTTTKELVAHLLSARYRVLKTPASFNTPLGIARTVNDSLDGQEYFVVEMGAYRRGEIEKLCRLVGGTDVSVITTVNAQHLERFGSLEATAHAKYEVVEGLKAGGTAVLNFDIAAVRARAGPRGDDVTVTSFGVESDDVTLRGSSVTETERGIEMDVTLSGETAHLETQLLARHNATNVLAALGVGLSCGLDLAYMAAALRRFQPPVHRLQPLQLDNGVTVLDDAYNANPEGIIGALEVLGRYTPRRRIVVTPGLIEMGREKAAYHARIGKAAAQTVDVAILVGPKQTVDIKEALLSAGFPADCLHVVMGLDEARAVLSRIGAAGDVVLYANDLPDQFDETLEI